MTTVRAMRTNKITIETHKHGGAQWIHIDGMEVTLNENDDVVDTGERHLIHKQAADDSGTPNIPVVTKVVTVTDPVTQQPVTASVAGLRELIRQVAIDWYNEELGTVHDTTLNKAVFSE